MGTVRLIMIKGVDPLFYSYFDTIYTVLHKQGYRLLRFNQSSQQNEATILQITSFQILSQNTE